MEYLPPTIMNNYVTCFRLLTHLGVNNIWADYANALLLGTNSRKKKECGHFGQRTSIKKGSAALAVVGLNDNRVVYIASSKFSEPKRFVWHLKKVEGKYIQEQQPN